MRAVTLFILFVFFCTPLLSQERDSLFSNSLFYNSLYDDGTFIDSSYVKNLVRETEEATGEKKIGLLHKLLNGYYFTNPELTRQLAQKSLELSREESNDSLLAFSLHYLGIAYIYLDQHRLSIDTYTKALATPFAKRRNDFKSWCSMNIANSYLSLRQYDKAAEFYYQAAKLNEQIGNKSFAGKVYDNLGNLFLEINNLEESYKNYRTALDLLDPQKDKRIISSLYSNLAVLEIKKNNFAKADEYFQQSLINSKALNDSSIIIENYSVYANALYEKDQYRKSKSIFERAISYCNVKNYEIDYLTLLHGLGRSLLYLNDLRNSENLLLKSRDGLKSKNALAELSLVEKSLSKLYAKKGDWINFNYHLSKAEEYKDSELAEKELATVNELKILHETEKKDRQLENQKLLIASRENQLFLSVVIGLLLLTGLIVSLYLRSRLKRTNRILYEKNIDITKRWNQLQHFYLIRKENQEKAEEVTLFTKINTSMTEDKLFKSPELTIDLLAKNVNSNTKYVSQAINENAEMNFSTYINTFRIEEAKQLLKGDETQNWSMEAIAESCGFNNPTSFYQAFKKNTGMTPASFKNTNIEAA